MMEQPSFGFTEEVVEETTYSVVQLNSMVGEAVRRAQPDELWVKGEVQNLRTRNGHTYFKLVEKAGQGERIQGRLDVALFSDDAPKIRRGVGRGAGRGAGRRRRGADPRPRARLPAHRPVPAGHDRHRPGVHRRSARGQPRAGAAASSRPKGCSAPTARLELPPVPLRVGLITSERQRRLPRLRRRAAAVAVRVAGRRGRRRGAERGRRAAHQVGARAARAARRRRRGARPRWRLACRPRAVRHRAGGAGDRGDGRAGVHRRRARDRPQRRRRGRVHRRARPPPRARRCSSAGSTTSWVRSTTRRSGWRRERASAWPSPAASSTRPRAGPCAARRGRWSREQSRLDRAHGRLDELARRRTVDLGAHLDACAASR